MPHFVSWNLNLDQTISLSRQEFRAQQSLLLAAVAVAVPVIGPAAAEQAVFCLDLPIP
jgi:hypothetical protein